ncbi:MFS transporter [Streptomyces sp. NPDC051014]|uniref:MFS transporter n=1 Tax=Streptomyces sp. NPDC051014 TaxID=3155751 RepID=UPI0033E8E216
MTDIHRRLPFFAGATEEGDGAGRMSVFASLRIRNYRLYMTGQSISVGGNWMQTIAVGWLTLQLTHSGTMLGVVTCARYLPLLLLGAWGGLVVDRHDSRRLLTLTQVCAAVEATALAALSWAHMITLGLLIVLMLALGVISVFENPSRQSLIGELVDRKHLSNAIAISSTLINIAMLMGPALAGIIIARLGVTPCFVLDALSYLAVIGSLLALRSAEMIPAEQEIQAKGQIRAGLLYIWRTPALLQPMIMVYVAGILTWEFPVTLPLLTSQTFHAGPDAYGTSMAIMSAGAILGGFVAMGRRTVTVRTLSLSAVGWGTVICAAALAPSLPLTLAVLVLVGFGSITFNSSARTVLQVESAPHMRGRVMAIWSIGWMGSSVIGAPIVGTIGAVGGPRVALLTGGLGAVAVGAVVLGLSTLGRRTPVR